mgnify:FL=1
MSQRLTLSFLKQVLSFFISLEKEGRFYGKRLTCSDVFCLGRTTTIRIIPDLTFFVPQQNLKKDIAYFLCEVFLGRQVQEADFLDLENLQRLFYEASKKQACKDGYRVVFDLVLKIKSGYFSSLNKIYQNLDGFYDKQNHLSHTEKITKNLEWIKDKEKELLRLEEETMRFNTLL